MVVNPQRHRSLPDALSSPNASDRGPLPAKLVWNPKEGDDSPAFKAKREQQEQHLLSQAVNRQSSGVLRWIENNGAWLLLLFAAIWKAVTHCLNVATEIAGPPLLPIRHASLLANDGDRRTTVALESFRTHDAHSPAVGNVNPSA